MGKRLQTKQKRGAGRRGIIYIGSASSFVDGLHSIEALMSVVAFRFF
ncbi:hypothetical protein KDA_13410 [Dictyobacter alpinus]|uniref:Uncharacterized protein n=1 Tax=Dictyobacter alpinus TaxID=2014873 RepID=A0A402B3G8_9CHLR|nr:hypothetical protein KDA_13410 [Dictyobacter alpinus]